MSTITVGKALSLVVHIQDCIDALNRNSTLLLPFAARRTPLLRMVEAIIEKSGSFRLDLPLTAEAEKEFLGLAEAYGVKDF